VGLLRRQRLALGAIRPVREHMGQRSRRNPAECLIENRFPMGPALLNDPQHVDGMPPQDRMRPQTETRCLGHAFLLIPCLQRPLMGKKEAAASGGRPSPRLSGSGIRLRRGSAWRARKRDSVLRACPKAVRALARRSEGVRLARRVKLAWAEAVRWRRAAATRTS